MKAVTDYSGSKGTGPTGTVIQFSVATGCKRSQKTPSSHTPHDMSPVTSSLSHLPPNFCCPYFWTPHHHCVAQLPVSPLNCGHLTRSIQEISHLLTDRQIQALLSGLCWTAPLCAQETENCHSESIPLSSPQRTWELQPPLKGNSMGEGKSSYTVLGNQNLFLLGGHYTG